MKNEWQRNNLRRTDTFSQLGLNPDAARALAHAAARNAARGSYFGGIMALVLCTAVGWTMCAVFLPMGVFVFLWGIYSAVTMIATGRKYNALINRSDE